MDSNRDLSSRSIGRHVGALALAGVAALGIAACTPSNDSTTEARRPQQAGLAVNPITMAGHIAAARANVVVGDQRAAQAHLKAAANDMTRSMRIPDASRPIDHEAARAAVRPIAGVRTSLWLDRANFVAMIGQVCLAIEPLTDTLAVDVPMQNINAKKQDGSTGPSRNCHLPEGERALMWASGGGCGSGRANGAIEDNAGSQTLSPYSSNHVTGHQNDRVS